MIGMMNAGTVDVPAEFYGEYPDRKGKRSKMKSDSKSRLFTQRQMLREKISYGKDCRMLVNGRLAASNEVLSPSQLWENLMMRVMCRAVCESYMKEPPPQRRRMSDYLPWRRRPRNGAAAAKAIANAATAVSELQQRAAVANDDGVKHKSSTGSENSKTSDASASVRKIAAKISSDNSPQPSDASLPLQDKTSTPNIIGNNKNRPKSFISSNNNLSNSNNSKPANGSGISFLRSQMSKTSIENDTVNSLAAKISAKITRSSSGVSTNATRSSAAPPTPCAPRVTAPPTPCAPRITAPPTPFSPRITAPPTPCAPRITRSSSSASLKSPNALVKPNPTTTATVPNVEMRSSPSRTRRPLSFSALTSLTTRAIPRPPIGTSLAAQSQPQTPQPKVQVGARRPLHTLGNTPASSRFFGIASSKISSLTNTKTHNHFYNKVH